MINAEQPNYKNDDHRLICCLANENISVFDIADKFEVSQETIRRTLRRYGIMKKTARPLVIELLKEGKLTIPQIAERAEVSDITVKRIKSEEGIGAPKREASTMTHMQAINAVKRLKADSMTTQEACDSVGVTVNWYNYNKGLERNKT